MQYFDYSETDTQNKASEKITVLEGLAEEEWQKVIRYAQSVDFKPGMMLLKAGESDDSLNIVVTGQVEVINPNSFGILKRIATIGEGSVFGELAFFDGQPRSASIRAITEGQLLRLSRKGFDRIAAWNPSLAQQLLFDLGRILAYRFRSESPYKI
jgi:CRP/FNR family transcriptional regulator, cyclic AMP receptor protein